MKKLFFISFLLIILFNSCYSKSNKKAVKLNLVTAKEKSLEAAKRLDALIASDNKEIDSETLNKKGDIEVYVHNQMLDINEQAIKIYSKPFSKKEENIIYITQNGDKISVTKILYSKSYKRTCIEVNLPSNQTGFIPLSENPYKDGQFSFREEINVNGKTVKVLNLNRQYTFESFTNDVAIIHTQPDYESDVIAKISNDIRLECQAITADYNWLCVTYENQEGWINTKYLCRGIGGPVLNTPEEMICEELLWSGYR